jgi:hypothetical protein
MYSFYPAKFSQVRALAADKVDLCFVNIPKTKYK